jgi:hypothetical protein
MDYTKIITEVVVVLVGVFGTIVLHKAQAYLGSLKDKNQLGIVTSVTEQVVKWAEAELSGSAGKDKRDFAVKQALDILAGKGIRLDEASVIAGIEEGVTKLKEHQLNTKSIEAYFTPTPAPVVTPTPSVVYTPSTVPVTVSPLTTATTITNSVTASDATTIPSTSAHDGAPTQTPNPQ